MDELRFETELIQYLCHGAVSSAQSPEADSVAERPSIMSSKRSSGSTSPILRQPINFGKTSRTFLRGTIGQRLITL